VSYVGESTWLLGLMPTAIPFMLGASFFHLPPERAKVV
jgi:hypothetical protein